MPRTISFFAAAAILGAALCCLHAEPMAPPAPMPAGVPASAAPVAQTLPEKSKRRKTADEFFAGPIIQLEFQFEPEQWQNLKKDNREYAACTLTETDPDGKKITYSNVAVKLKGSAGSFQAPDKKPGLTIGMDKFAKGQKFHGMDKFHLNNSMQDRSFLNEFIAGEWCRACGVPASRCTHVLVKWNGRDTGLYVLKEGFTKDFLSYFFEQNEGGLYDGHFIAEIDGDLEKQQGNKDDRSDIQGLVAAAKEPDEKVRWQKLYEKLDVDAFLRFLALESMVEQWDGYNFTRNNYRLYFDSKTGKAYFFAHGMDNVLNESNGPLFREPIALVGTAVLSNPEWRAHYRKVVEALYDKVIKPTDWDARLVDQGKRIQEALARQSPAKADAFEANIRNARDRLKARVTGIGRLLGEPDPSMVWKDGVWQLGADDWRGGRGAVPQQVEVDGHQCFYLRVSDLRGAGRFPAAFRRSVILPPGRYRFEGQVKVAGVQGAGADLSIRGAPAPNGAPAQNGAAPQNGAAAQNSVTGDADWQKISCEFDATGEEIFLVGELRATAGEAWFRPDTFQIVKLK